ncbi:hypothetical protein SCUP234_07525 [Seiridium cupressi]
MTSYDTAVSNGTCYWRIGEEAGRDFIPCGNAYSSEVNFQCCTLGDVCFDNGACYNADYGATYFAACTDPDYKASECPDKGRYSDRQWTGLVTCGTSTGQFNKDETWAGCPEPNVDHLTYFTKGCKCNDSNPALFTDYAALVRTAVLPTETDGTITFVNGHKASTVFVSATTSTSTSSGSSLTKATTLIASPTSSEIPGATSPFVDDAAGPSSGTKAAIGGGVAGGVLLVAILAALAWFLRRRRRQKGKDLTEEPKPSLHGGSTSTARPSSAINHDQPDNTHGFTGYKAELAADGPPSGDTMVSPLSPDSARFPGQQRQYEAYNPDRHGNYSQYTDRSGNLSPHRDTIYGSVLSVTPQHTGSTLEHPSSANERTGQRAMAPIAELPG